jgi:hypothetical protein
MSCLGCDGSKNTIDSNNHTGQNGKSGPLHNIWSIFHVQKDFLEGFIKVYRADATAHLNLSNNHNNTLNKYNHHISNPDHIIPRPQNKLSLSKLAQNDPPNTFTRSHTTRPRNNLLQRHLLPPKHTPPRFPRTRQFTRDFCDNEEF